MISREPGRRRRVPVTGAGGPAAIAAMKSLRADGTLEVLAADTDPRAAGLYLVPPGSRMLIPPGAAPGFADAVLDICVALGTVRQIVRAAAVPCGVTPRGQRRR